MGPRVKPEDDSLLSIAPLSLSLPGPQLSLPGLTGQSMGPRVKPEDDRSITDVDRNITDVDRNIATHHRKGQE